VKGFRERRRQKAEDLNNFRVGIYAPALLWFEARSAGRREVLTEGGRELS
jgi:hypothetical protein